MNFNEHLKSILGSQIMCINIYTSLASAQRNSFIAKSNAKLDFSFPLVFIYILHIWLKITCLKPIPLLLSAYTYTHTHIHADIRAYIYTRVQTSTWTCVYLHITYSRQEASVQRLSDKNFLHWLREKRVPCSLTFPLPIHSITALQAFFGRRAVHKSMESLEL